MKHNFLTCGTCGWCMEILFTGLHSLQNENHKLTGNTSIWMFPIYGMASFLSPICRRLKGKSLVLRGGGYTCLRKFEACPWDYSEARLNVNGLIRLDYAPLWFCAGLLFEKILCRR